MKVTKKLLSVFLAVLMAMSCCVAAFPTIAEAALSGDDLSKLNQILQYAINTGEITAWSASQSGTTKTITDNSTHGVIFDASKYIRAVANTKISTADNAYANYHVELQDAVINATAYAGNGNVQNLIRAVLQGEGQSEYHHRNDKSSKYSSAGNSGVPGSATFYTVITRSVTQAYLSIEYASLDEVPDNVATTRTLQVSLSRRSGDKDWLGRRRYWLAFSGQMSLSDAYSASNVQTLKNYKNYFTSLKINEDLAVKSYAELVAQNNTNVSYQNSVAGFASQIFDKYFTAPTKGQIDTYVSNVALWIDRAYIRETLDRINAAMAATPVDTTESSAALRSASAAVAAELKNITDRYSSSHQAWSWAVDNYGFNKAAIDKYINDTLYKASFIDIKAQKDILDPVIAAHPTAADIATMETDALLADRATVKSAYESAKAINAADGRNAFIGVFADGDQYVIDWLNLTFTELDTRNLAADAVMQDEITGTFPRPFIDDIDFSGIPTDDIFLSYLNPGRIAYQDLKNKYSEAAIINVFGQEYIDAIEAYLDRANAELVKRFREDAANVDFFYTAAGNKVGLGNYKSIIDTYENESEWQIINVPYVIKTTELNNLKNHVDYIYNLALQVRANKWTTDTASWVERVIDWPAREARDADLARSVALNETYFTSEEKTQNTLDVIDEFLLSDDFGTLLDLKDADGNPVDLEGTVQDLLQQEVFTNEMVNTLVNALYPMLDQVLWDAVQENAQVDAGFFGTISFRDDAQKSVYQSLERLDLYLHPRKFASRLNSIYGSRYDNIEAILNTSGSGHEYGGDHWWNMTGGVNGELPEDADWGVHDKESFLTAMGAAFCGFTPLLRAILGNTPVDGSIKATVNVLIDISFNLDLHADAVNGYDNAIAPLFEALGVGGEYLPTVAEVNACTTSDQLIKTAIGPIFTWLEEEVMTQPVETIAKMLPNLVYNLNIGNVLKWIKTLKTNINLSGFKGLLNQDIAIDLYDMALKDLLGTHNLDSLNDVIAFVKEQSADLAGLNLTLSQDEEAALAACGILRSDLPSKTSSGRRLGVEANGAKVFATLLMWVFKNVDVLLGAIESMGTTIELPEEVAPILDNLKANPGEAFAALIELFNPQTYASHPYEWWQRSAGDGAVPGASASAYVYLKYGNDWSYEKANMLYERIDDILSVFLKDQLESAGYADAGEWVNDQIQNMFDNDAITGVVKMLTSLSAVTENETVDFIISRFAGGMDFGIWSEDFGYLFVTDADREDPEFVEPLQPGDAGYDEQNSKLDLLTVRPNPDRTEAQIEAGKEEYIWTYNGVDLENDNREQFAQILGYLFKELTPALDIFLSGKDGTLFNALTIKGYNGYDSAIIPLLEAFGVPSDLIKDQAEFNALGDADQKVQYLINLAFDYVDSISGENLVKILLVDVIPSLVYFLQSNGLSTLLLNLLQPVLVILDTARPIYDLDINGLVGGLLNESLADTLPEGTTVAFDIKDLSIHALAPLGEALTGLDLSPLVYGVDAICSVDNYKTSSKSAVCGNERYTFYEGIGAGADSNKNDPANTITVLLSLVLDLVMYGDNAKVLDDMIFDGEKHVIEQVRAALRTADIDPGTLRTIDWFYFNDLYTDESDKLDYTAYDGSDISLPIRTNYYIRYANDLGMNPENLWTEELATFLDESLADLADMIISSSTDYATIGEYLNSVWKDGGEIYTEKTVAKIAASIRDILPEEIQNFADLIQVFLEVDLHYWDSYDPETASEEPMTQAQFAKALAEVFTPLDGLLSWLLTGRDYKFFYSQDGADQIVLAGGNGYETCIIPILEALGCTLPELEEGDTAVSVLEKTINAVLSRVNGLVTSESPVDAVLDILPNLIYFLNANGLSISVINLCAPVIGLVEAVAPAVLGDEYTSTDVETLLDELTGMPVSKLNLMNICQIVKDQLGLDIAGAVTMNITDSETGETFAYNYLENFYVGEITPFRSVNGSWSFRMGYSDSENVREGRADLITVLIYTVFDVFNYSENAAFLEDALGAEMYNGIRNLLRTQVSEYEGMDWFYFDDTVTAADFADGAVLPVDPAVTTMAYLLDSYLQYNDDNIWSKETAEAFRSSFYDIVDMIVASVAEDGSTTAGEYIRNLWGSANLYSKKNVYAIGKSIGEAITGIDANIRDLLGLVLDIDLTAWDEYINTEITDENNEIYTKDQFASELVKIFAPFGKILDWLLVGEDKAISLFFLNDNSDAISIGGANGFEKGLVPLLEALDCEVEYNADPLIGSFTGKDALEVTVNALLDRVEAIVNAEDPVEQVVAMLPNLIYFINANGLSVSVLNLLAAVTNVLDRVAEMQGETADLNALLGLDEQGIDVYRLDFVGICNIVYATTGLDVLHAVSLPEMNADGNYVTDSEGNMVFQPSYLESFAIGEVVQYESANGEIAYRMQYSSDPNTLDAVDMFTILICSVLDVFKFPGNAEFFKDTFGEEQYDAILAIMNTTVDPDTYSKFDWFYFDAAVGSDSFPEDGSKVTVSYEKSTMGYLQYNNIWNEDTATYIRENFYDIADTIIKAATGGSEDGGFDTVASYLNDAWSGAELYSKKNVYKVGKMIGEAIQDLDDTLKTVVGVILGVDTSVWDVYINTEITDENNVIYDRATFINELLEIFRPFSKILDWILVGEENALKIFYGKDGSNAIEIGGGNGFEEGLIPILEAFGCTVPDYDPETLDSIGALRITIDCLLGKVDAVAASDDAVEQVVAMLPNLIYFINANGLSVSVRNLITPVICLLEKVAVLTGDDYSDLNSLFGLDEMGIDVYNLDIVGIFNIVKALTGINVNDAVTYEGVNLYETFAMGEVERYTSANGRTAYRMMYSDDATALNAIDMLTILVSTVLNVFTYDENEAALTELLGEDTFTGINAVLSLKKDDKYLNYRWLFTKNNYTEIADEWVDKAASPLQGTTENFDYAYDEYWTREKALEVSSHLNDFIAELATLLGIQINGVDIDSVGDLVSSLVGESLYTQKNINKIAKKLCDALAKIDEVDEDGHIKAVVKSSLGVDLAVYDQYKGGNTDWGFADGDRQGFTNALVELVRPLLPVLKWVLLNEDLAIFNDLDGSDMVVLPGGNGYVEGVIPILEALDRSNPSIASPEKYYADAAVNEDTLITNILNPVFDFVDYVLADPLNRIFEVLPGLIYFINSKGLDTSFKNLLHPVYQVLTAIEPMVQVDLYELIGFNLETLDFEMLYGMLIDKLGEQGAVLKPLVGSALQELTVGKMVAFTSRTGDKAFTMEYVNDDNAMASKADMFTVILRLALKWLTMEENRDTIRAWIRENTSEDNTEYVIALYDTFAEYTSKPHGINMILGALYYVYYGVDKGTEGALDWFEDTNGKWKFIMGLFDEAESDYLDNFGKIFKGFIDKYTDDVIDSDGLASDGLVPFFQRIINWFKKLVQWFKDLFAR